MLPCPEGSPSTLIDVGALRNTQALGERLGRTAVPGDVLLLSGPLGSGKTALTQGFARGLACAEVINSPTFTLLKEHLSGRIPLYHFDLYRLDDPAEIWSLGFEEYFNGAGVCVVEWAERAPEAWTMPHLWLELAVTGTHKRRITGCARGARGAMLLAQCAL